MIGKSGNRFPEIILRKLLKRAGRRVILKEREAGQINPALLEQACKTGPLSLAQMKYVYATILFLIPAFAMADGTSVPYNVGGPHAKFNPVIAQYNQSGERFRIEGQCKSSCPMLLGIRNVCVDRNASLLFHGANDNSHIIRPPLNNHLLSHFNGKLRTYLVSNHVLETLDFHTISGLDIIQKFGYRECPR